MLVIMDLITMDAIPFMIKQTHCPNPACQAPTQTPPRSFDSSGSMIAPYLLGEIFELRENVEIHEMASCPMVCLVLLALPPLWLVYTVDIEVSRCACRLELAWS